MVGNTIFGRYKIIAKLSQSNFNTTYIAKDTQLPGHPRCLVKQLTPLFDQKFILETAQRLFNQEAEVLQKLGSHNQIPTLLAYYTHNQKFYLVEEFIEGHNLQQEFNQILSESEVINLVLELLNILVFVQKNNYIHRDIKPENLIRRASDHKIVLIDFDAVKEKLNSQITKHKGHSNQTVIIGTEGYLPPEQKLGHPGFYSDIYAVGMIAIRGLTGMFPKNLVDREGKVIWRNHLPTKINYNSNFLSFLDKMVASDHKNRYQSATEALDYLTKLITPTDVNKQQEYQEENAKIPQANITHHIFFRSLGIIVIISAIAIFWFKLSSKENFLTYKNNQYGITVDYPSSWDVKKNDDLYHQEVIFISPLENNQDLFQERITIAIERLSSSSISLPEYTKSLNQEISKNFQQVRDFKQQQAILSNNQAIQLIYSYQENRINFKKMMIATLKNNRAYIVVYTAEKNKYNQFSNWAKKMANSLVISNPIP